MASSSNPDLRHYGLPEGMPSWTPKRLSDGAEVPVVTLKDAAKLAGVSIVTMRRWVDTGKVAICYTPESDIRVFLDRLWAVITAKRG